MEIIKYGINLRDSVITRKAKFVCSKCGCVFRPTNSEEVRFSPIKKIYSVECPNNTCRHTIYTIENLKEESE